jgi:hypothetical protein
VTAADPKFLKSRVIGNFLRYRIPTATVPYPRLACPETPAQSRGEYMTLCIPTRTRLTCLTTDLVYS